MKAIITFRILLVVILLGIFSVLPQALRAQCRTDVNYGQNIVVNGDFSNGYTGWGFTPQTVPWNPAVVGAADGYRIHGSPSLPGDIFVGTNPNAQFNGGFQTFGDHTTGSGNFLMVDGVCKLGVKLFTQTVNVAPTTNYYFSVWINSLKDNATNPGVLNFDVGGANIGANITAPALGGASVGGGWVKHEVVWNSGAISGNVVISIENQNTLDCGNQVDFAIDDIAFIPGCSYGAPGPQPDLGPDQSLCGTGGSITLHANVPMLPTTTVSWSDGTSNTGSNPAFYSRVISSPGTYAVCVSDNGSCVKSDVIVITNTFSINIGGPYNFCSSSSQTLDAGFTGIGVTYRWYNNITNTLLPYPNDTKTYTATAAGTYRVDVTVPGCGTQSSTTTITSTAPVAPIDAYFCATSGDVNGLVLGATGANSANLSWYTTPTGGTPIASGVTTPNATTTQYTLPTIPQTTTLTQTYYVQDNTTSTGSLGPATYSNGNNSNDATAWNQNYLKLTVGGDFTINSLQIPFIFYNPPSAFNVTLEIADANGVSFSPKKLFTSANTVTPIANGDNKLVAFTFTGFNVLKSWGTNLTLKIVSHTSVGQVMRSTSGYTYPYNSSIPNVVSIPSAIYGNTNITTGGYPYLFNWNITAPTVCSRTPVRAISNCPTPVTWTSFYLIPQDDNSCKLVWSTADERNNAYFSIERSIDGIHFETIATTIGGGNRDIASNYYYVDHAPLSGTSYYRITQHDYDGKFSSTAMKVYSTEGLIQVTTYPNPFQHNTTLLVSGSTDEIYNYTIYSVNGQLVEEGTGTLNQTQTIAETQTKGMYMLTVITSTDIITTKIVKQ